MRLERLREPRLTAKQYWDVLHGSDFPVSKGAAPGVAPEGAKPISRAGLKARGRRLLGARLREALRNYDDYLLWERILPRYLSRVAGSRAVEVGSAPGEFLARLHERFGLEPYGIEYSPVGAERNRQVFAAHGIAPDRVIQADFFAPEIDERYHEAFDIVVSRGFIEHFRDVEDVVARHLALLRPGGLLIVLVPNLKGVNRLLSWFFDRRVLAMHNLEIMRRDRYARLFPEPSVRRLFCDYYGVFNLCLFSIRPGSPMRPLLLLGMKLQLALNALFRLVLREGRAESRWFSPNLLFVGVKR